MDSDNIDTIDRVTEAMRKAGAFLRAAQNDPPERDREWLLSMALEAIEAGEPALRRLNRLGD